MSAIVLLNSLIDNKQRKIDKMQGLSSILRFFHIKFNPMVKKHMYHMILKTSHLKSGFLQENTEIFPYICNIVMTVIT